MNASCVSQDRVRSSGINEYAFNPGTTSNHDAKNPSQSTAQLGLPIHSRKENVNIIFRFLQGVFCLTLLTMPTFLLAGETVMVYRVDQPSFTEAYKGIADELREKYKVIDESIDDKMSLSYDDFKSRVLASHPNVLVVMENRLVNHAAQLAVDVDPQVQAIKIVVSMGINLKKAIKGIPKMCGIGYEVAPFSIISNLNQVIEKPARSVLIIYRKSVFQDYVTDAIRQLERAGIKVIAVDAELSGVESGDIESFIKKNLSDLSKKDEVDAILVMGDNGLVNKKTMPLWIKASQKVNKPFVTGIDQLVNKKMDFCAFATSPNHYEMGVQIAQLVSQILEDGANVDALGVEYPVRTHDKIDKDKLKKLKIKLRNDRPKDIIGDEK